MLFTQMNMLDPKINLNKFPNTKTYRTHSLTARDINSKSTIVS